VPRAGQRTKGDWKAAVLAFRDYAKDQGLRFTREREEIVRAVFTLEDHFSVARVAETVEAAGGTISLATVYRNMDHLQKAGLVKEVKCGLCYDEQVYEHLHEDRHHDHLTCIECGTVVEFEDEAIEVLQKHVAGKYGFELVRHHLDLQGRCAACRERKQAANAGGGR
jgi:Fur family transcriptional regulator, ferric uptake regulator